MKPDREGIWEWFDSDGVKRLVCVFDTNTELRNVTGHAEPALEVYWWGGYYNINDEVDELSNGTQYVNKAQWTDSWGGFIGEIGSIPDEQLYLGPTPELRAKIFAKLNQ